MKRKTRVEAAAFDCFCRNFYFKGVEILKEMEKVNEPLESAQETVESVW